MNEFTERLMVIKQLNLVPEIEFLLTIIASIENYEKETGKKLTYEEAIKEFNKEMYKSKFK